MSVEQKELTRTYEFVTPPKMYTCVVHNDDITTMDFVVMALCKVFNKSSYEATRIMTHIHHKGKANVGIFCYDIAITKKGQMDSLARVHNFPLKTTVEEADAQ